MAINRIRGPILNPIGDVLKLCGMNALAGYATYMYYPNDSAHGAIDKHFIYMPQYGWVDPTTLDTQMGAMVGTLNADGTGGSLSYTPELLDSSTVDRFSVVWDSGGGVIVCPFSLGFNRALTATEKAALSSTAFWSLLFAGTSITTGACAALASGYEFQDMCFKLKVKTDNPGSASDTFVLPTPGMGTYAYTMDWGNGSRQYITANTSQTKDYNQVGTFIAKVYGVFPSVFFIELGDCLKLIGLQIGDVGWTSFLRSFAGCASLTTMIGHANTSSATNMSHMFAGCAAFNQSVSRFNTSLVTDMSSMFASCSAFNQSLSNFNTANVTDMSFMFNGCSAFNQSISNFSTALVTDMSYMFTNCSVFNQSVSSFNTALVTDMSIMFAGCNVFNQSVSSFNTANVTNMSFMFGFCFEFNQPISNFDTSSVVNMSFMFTNCFKFNQSVSNFNTANVTNMSAMFYYCFKFNQSVASFNTANVTNMSGMFYTCVEFDQSVAGFSTANVTNMNAMFYNCLVFNQSVAGFNTANVIGMNSMFRSCSAFKQSLSTFSMGLVSDATNMLEMCDINDPATSTNYDDTLVSWAAQDLVNGLAFNGGTSKYSNTGQVARSAIIADDLWTITDGGHI